MLAAVWGHHRNCMSLTIIKFAQKTLHQWSCASMVIELALGQMNITGFFHLQWFFCATRAFEEYCCSGFRAPSFCVETKISGLCCIYSGFFVQTQDLERILAVKAKWSHAGLNRGPFGYWPNALTNWAMRPMKCELWQKCHRWDGPMDSHDVWEQNSAEVRRISVEGYCCSDFCAPKFQSCVAFTVVFLRRHRFRSAFRQWKQNGPTRAWTADLSVISRTL
jgi:hypothetical protein